MKTLVFSYKEFVQNLFNTKSKGHENPNLVIPIEGRAIQVWRRYAGSMSRDDGLTIMMVTSRYALNLLFQRLNRIFVNFK